MKILEKFKVKANDIRGEKPVTLAFLGDSCTQGCFECHMVTEDRLTTVYEYKNAYSTRLKEILNILYPNLQVNVINSGIDGGSAVKGLGRIERDILNFNPDLCVVSFLLNDSTHGEKGLDEYRNALKGIFDKLKERNIEIIMMLPVTMCYKTSYQLKDKFFINLSKKFSEMQNSGVVDKYIEAAKSVCKENNVKLVDLATVWGELEKNGVDTTELLTNKLNHPFREYHYYIAIKLLEAMFEI